MDINKKIEKLNLNLNLQKFDEVIIECKKLIKLKPNISILYNIYGLALQGKKKHKESFNFFSKAIEVNDKDFAPKVNLANTYMYLNDFKNAEKLFKNLLIDKPDDYILIANYANFKRKIKDFKSAVKLYETSSKISKNHYMILNDLAKSYQNIGEFDKSRKTYEKILEQNPNSIEAHISLNRLLDYSKNQDHLKIMLELYGRLNLNSNDKALICFAIGKAYEDLKNYKESFSFFKKGNELIESSNNYNFEKELKLIKNIKKIIEKIKNYKNKKEFDDRKIIFVCGLPRSGTTLVEQILSSHKEVIGIGEVEYLENSINNIFINDDKILNQNFKENINSNKNILNDMYFNNLDLYNYQSNVIIDKTPHNFRWIGFIKVFFPNSKIVLCERNIKDNFLSLYKNYFASIKHMGWTYEPSKIVEYCKMYTDLIKFWENKYSSFIYKLNYDKLVLDKEHEIKKLLEFCDLAWDINCLSHYNNTKSIINTVSIYQARKPIYSSSSNLNKNYEAFLSDYFQKL